MPELQIPPADLFESYAARRESAKTLLGFSLVYLTGYFTDPPATFHPQLINALQDSAEKRILIIGFRGSGNPRLALLPYGHPKKRSIPKTT